MATPILDAIERNRPLIGGILKAVLDPAVERARGSMRPVDEIVDAIAPSIAAKIENNPVLKNELNLETPTESRTTVWAAGTILLALSSLFLMLKTAWQTGEFNTEAFALALGSLITGGNVIRGRWATGLAPLQWPKVFMPWKWGK